MSIQPHGLRELKKAQTRAAIQYQAFILFKKQGYTTTTTLQIAAAAGISPATFFRYFPTKEDVVFFDALDFIMHEGGEPPAQLSPIAAVRWILTSALEALSEQELTHQRERYFLIQSVPELRARMADEIITHTDLLIAMIAKRSRQERDDIGVRVLASAIIGVLLTTLLTCTHYSNTSYIQLLHDNLTELEERMKQ